MPLLRAYFLLSGREYDDDIITAEALGHIGYFSPISIQATIITPAPPPPPSMIKYAPPIILRAILDAGKCLLPTKMHAERLSAFKA